MEYDNFRLLDLYIRGSNLVLNKHGILDLYKLKHYLDCYGDKEFCRLVNGDANNMTAEGLDLQAIINHCKKKN